MRLAAVAAISLFNNSIKQKIVEISEDATWKDAFTEAMSKGLTEEIGVDETGDGKRFSAWIKNMPENLAEARVELGDGEMDICVTFWQS